MRKIVYIFAIMSFVISCNAQKTIVETKSKDILVFEFKNQNIQLTRFYTKVYNEDNTLKETIEASENKQFYSNENILINTQEWQGYGSRYFDKKYSFIKEKDTMNIECRCGQEQNYYFENLKFKKGNYELNFDFPKKYNQQTKKYEVQRNLVLGKEIETPKEVQKILFRNTYPWGEENNNFKDLYFKDLKFIKIDLNDTINVKLKEIE